MNTQAYVTEGVTSNTLLRLAVEAVRDGVIESFEVRRTPIVLTEYYIVIDRGGDEMRFTHDWIEEAIAYIRSQYVETFDIRNLDDLQCIKEGAMGVLLNGSQFEVVRDSSNYENRDRVVINVGGANIYVNLAILVGARVTQDKYKDKIAVVNLKTGGLRDAEVRFGDLCSTNEREDCNPDERA